MKLCTIDIPYHIIQFSANIVELRRIDRQLEDLQSQGYDVSGEYEYGKSTIPLKRVITISESGV